MLYDLGSNIENVPHMRKFAPHEAPGKALVYTSHLICVSIFLTFDSASAKCVITTHLFSFQTHCQLLCCHHHICDRISHFPCFEILHKASSAAQCVHFLSRFSHEFRDSTGRGIQLESFHKPFTCLFTLAPRGVGIEL